MENMTVKELRELAKELGEQQQDVAFVFLSALNDKVAKAAENGPRHIDS